jgi:hypothetical protein
LGLGGNPLKMLLSKLASMVVCFKTTRALRLFNKENKHATQNIPNHGNSLFFRSVRKIKVAQIESSM